MKISVINAFTDGQAFSGNPAAVCLVHDFPDFDLMQSIASAMNLSQTAFVKMASSNSYHIRWFTPNSEAPICAHATLASYYVLQLSKGEDLQQKSTTETIFHSLAGDLIVSHCNEWIELNFPLYNLDALSSSDIDYDLLQQLCQTTPLYVGLSKNCLFLELQSESDVRNLTIDYSLLKKLPYRSLLVTAKSDTLKLDFVFRYFAPTVAIEEDPVCGSAHCRLGPYWHQKSNKIHFTSMALSKRGGIVKSSLINEQRVLISGKAFCFLQGNLHLNLS